MLAVLVVKTGPVAKTGPVRGSAGIAAGPGEHPSLRQDLSDGTGF